MTQLVDVKVKDQYSQTYNVKAQLRQVPENSKQNVWICLNELNISLLMVKWFCLVLNCYLKVDKRKIYTELLINPIEKKPMFTWAFLWAIYVELRYPIAVYKR